MANPMRNESPLEINGRTLTLKLTFQAMQAIEQDTGLDWLQIADGMAEGNFPMRAVFSICTRGLQASGLSAVDALAEVEKSLENDGIKPCLDGAQLAYSQSVTSAVKSAEGNAEAPETANP